MEDVRDIGGVPLPYEPETAEIDQAYIQYKTDDVTVKAGRQVIALDGQRFIGHVGFRQDRQTFDGVRVMFEPVKGLKTDVFTFTSAIVSLPKTPMRIQAIFWSTFPIKHL